MVDAVSRPRVTFAPLYSDTRAGALTYHDYQRALRSQQVALLRDRSAMPAGARNSPHFSRLPSTRKTFHCKQQEDRDATAQNSTHQGSPKPAAIHVKTRDAAVIKTDRESDELKVPSLQVQSERLPRLFTHERLVKSATARDRHQSWPTHLPAATQQHRPKTATCSSSSTTPKHATELETVPTKDVRADKDESDDQDESKAGQQAPHKAWVPVEGSAREQEGVSAAAEREALVKAFCWSTTTQRANEEAGWVDCMRRPATPPSSTLEHFPDPVSQRLTFRRYHSAPADWQSFGCEWDFVQTRIGRFTKNNTFCSPHSKNGHLPGYLGFIAGGSEAEDPLSNFTPTTLIKTFKPRPSKISRRANIPGYTGHVHWSSMKPAHADSPHPEPRTTARVHRAFPLEEELSSFRRKGVFSKMITPVSPHNPFNSREP